MYKVLQFFSNFKLAYDFKARADQFLLIQGVKNQTLKLTEKFKQIFETFDRLSKFWLQQHQVKN